jgi:hypothetical protein
MGKNAMVEIWDLKKKEELSSQGTVLEIKGISSDNWKKAMPKIKEKLKLLETYDITELM